MLLGGGGDGYREKSRLHQTFKLLAFFFFSTSKPVQTMSSTLRSFSRKNSVLSFFLELLLSPAGSLLCSMPLPNTKRAESKGTTGFELEPIEWAKRLHMESTNHGTMKDITDLKLCMLKPES